MTKTLYDKLGVSRDSTEEEIREAFKDKAKEHHPDKGGKGEDMAEVNSAYLVLRDPVKRKRYDETGEENATSFDKRFDMLVNHIFMKIADAEQDVDYTNLVDLFEDQCELQAQQLSLKKEEESSKLRKMEKVLRRLEKSGDKRIGIVVSNNIMAVKQHIAVLDDEIKFLDDAIEVIGHHDYVVDVMPEQEYNYTFR